MIAGVVLAAGSGSRFGPGPPKVLARLDGVPLLHHVLEALRKSTVDHVVLVLGHGAEEVMAGCHLDRTTIVVNPDHARGQASSLKAGLLQVGDDAQAVVVALGDQPGITPEVVDALVEAHHRGLGPIVVPTYEGRRGNPVLLGRPVFAPAMLLDGDVGARAIMRERPDWVVELPADGLADPRDIDTPDDLRGLQGGDPI